MNFDPVFSDDPTADRILDRYVNLVAATRKGDILRVQKLLDNSAPVNHHLSNCYNLTPLHLAVQSRSLEIARLLLDKGADLNAKNMLGETPLILAAKTENIPLVDILLSYNVCNQEDKSHLSHLHIACMRNQVDIVKQLLSENQGENLNRPVESTSVFWQGYTPLHFAVRYGCIQTVEYLLKCGADFMVQESRALTPLHLADLQRNEIIIDLLLSAYKDEFQNPPNKNGLTTGLTPFHIACTRDDPSVVEHFLKLGVDVNLEVEKSQAGLWRGWQPIHFGMYYECPKVIDLLLRSGVYLESALFSKLLKHRHLMGCGTIYEKSLNSIQTSVEDGEKLSELYTLCIQDQVRPIDGLIANSTIRAPSDFNAPIWTGGASLHLAVKHKSADVTKYLLSHGANPLIQDMKCRTPLHLAFYYKFRDILMLIVGKLNDTRQNLADNNGLSIFHILCTTNELSVIKNFLDSDGVDVDAQVSDSSEFWAGFTPLHFACKYLQSEVVKLLLENHADIRIINRAGSNPFDFTIENMVTSFPSNCKTYFKILEKILLYLSTEPIQNLNTRGLTILHVMCCLADTESTNLLEKFLLNHEDKVNSAMKLREKHPFNGCTPLHLAMKFGNLEKTELMLAHGADPLITNSEGKTALEYACLHGLQVKVLAKHVDTLPSSKLFNQISRPSHFHIACRAASSKVIEDILKSSNEEEKKALVSCRNDNEQTVLHSLLGKENLKSKTSRLKRMRLLLKNGANPNERDYEWRTPLHFAHRIRDLEVVRLLVAYGADVNARDLYGITPLFQFCIFNSEESIALLLGFGADINLMDKRGRTCLTRELSFFLSTLPIFRLHRYYENEEKRIIVMLKHIKKLQLIGWFVSEKNERAYEEAKPHFNDTFDEDTFVCTCERELELMRLDSINHYLTVREILSKSPNKMVHHCENADLLKLLQSNEFYEKYPLYGRLVEVQFNKGALRRYLLSTTKKLLNFLDVSSIPQVCLEMIFEYLSNVDLEDIIAKGRSSNSL